jgi:hypothetical protein
LAEGADVEELVIALSLGAKSKAGSGRPLPPRLTSAATGFWRGAGIHLLDIVGPHALSV